MNYLIAWLITIVAFAGALYPIIRYLGNKYYYVDTSFIQFRPNKKVKVRSTGQIGYIANIDDISYCVRTPSEDGWPFPSYQCVSRRKAADGILHCAPRRGEGAGVGVASVGGNHKGGVAGRIS